MGNRLSKGGLFPCVWRLGFWRRERGMEGGRGWIWGEKRDFGGREVGLRWRGANLGALRMQMGSFGDSQMSPSVRSCFSKSSHQVDLSRHVDSPRVQRPGQRTHRPPKSHFCAHVPTRASSVATTNSLQRARADPPTGRIGWSSAPGADAPLRQSEPPALSARLAAPSLGLFPTIAGSLCKPHGRRCSSARPLER